MPKSEAADNHRKSNTPSKQEKEPHQVAADILSGKTENAEGSGENNAQFSFEATALTGYSTDIEGNTDVNDLDSQTSENLINDDEEATEAVRLAMSLMEEIKADLSLSNLDTAIFLFREVLNNYPTKHPLYADAMRDLASALGIRFMYTAQREGYLECLNLRMKIMGTFSLDREASHNQNNTFIRDEGDTDIQNTLQFAKEMLTDFQKSTSLHRLNTIIFLIQHSLSHISALPIIWMEALTTLVNALHARFNHNLGTSVNDLDEAILQHNAACSLQNNTEQTMVNCLERAVVLSFARFDVTGDLVELHEALEKETFGDIEDTTTVAEVIELDRIAAELLKCCTIGDGDMDDLNASVALYKEIMAKLHRGNEIYIDVANNLACALLTRFERGGQQSDLDEAISLYRQAFDLLLPSHPDRPGSLNNLAVALSTQFEQRGQWSDLDEAISLHRQALDLRLPPHPDRSNSLNNLANALRTRFEQGGQRSDLDEAISLHRQALDLRLAPHLNRSSSLNNLGLALSRRFEQGDQQSDLDEAISLHRQALDLRLPPHPNRPGSLNNLAGTLSTRFEQGGQQSDLDEAISFYRQALGLLLPPHPDRSSSLNNLAAALSRRFKQGSQQSDLDEAISLHRQALDLLLPPHPNRPSLLNDLAVALSTRFEQGGQQSDLDETITLHRQALDLRLPPHPERSSSLNNLANALLTQSEQCGEQTCFDEAMSLFSTASQYPFQSPSRRLEIARRWTRYTEQTSHNSAVEAYEAALNALSQVTFLSLDIRSRHLALTIGSDGLARKAARCAIRSGYMDKAIEFLEAGRSIFWSQVLSLRSPFDKLRSIAPDGPQLADRLQDIANALEIGSHRDVSAQLLDNRRKLFIDQEGSRLNRLNEEWDSILHKVRQFSGFEEFLLPPRLPSLKAAASDVPVVILIANDDQSHCLIMTRTTIHHIPVVNLRTPILQILVDNIRIAAGQSLISRSFIHETQAKITTILGEQRGISYQNNSESSDGIFRFVLGILWEELVKPIIALLDIKKSDMTVLRWCPTGLFTFLPIHAAGCYNDNLAIDCAQDYLISSYTPTIGALLSGPSEPSTQPFQMMAVIQSHELPSTRVELIKIQQYVPADALIPFGVPESPARVEDVASRLSDVAIVHFACHGTQNLFEPLESGLQLDDGRLQISRIMKEKMPNGSLAFLCACETAMGDANLPDEAMSIAASLIFSGFQRVVATMWAMRDEDGPTIADIFYRELFRGPDGEKALVPDVTKSARALHTAVQELRSQNVPFRRWVPFIHMGK